MCSLFSFLQIIPCLSKTWYIFWNAFVSCLYEDLIIFCALIFTFIQFHFHQNFFLLNDLYVWMLQIKQLLIINYLCLLNGYMQNLVKASLAFLLHQGYKCLLFLAMHVLSLSYYCLSCVFRNLQHRINLARMILCHNCLVISFIEILLFIEKEIETFYLIMWNIGYY